MASLLLGSLGSSLLGPIGGFIGSAIGSWIDNWLFAPKPEDIEGPRIEDRGTIAADPGVPIPFVFGADRVPGIVVHTTDLIETKHKKKVGGKGGPPSQTQITYTYHVDIDYMLSEGPILGVGRIWAEGRLIRGTRYSMDLDTDENFEKIGGIGYPNWYKTNTYRPEDTYWSYNPTYNAGITEPDRTYVFDKVAQVFYEIDVDPEAAAIVADPVHVEYHYDTIRDQMLPTPDSHDYTGGRIKDAEPPIFRFQNIAFSPLDSDSPPYPFGTPVAITGGELTLTGTTAAMTVTGYIDLRDIVGAEISGSVYDGQNTYVSSLTWTASTDVIDSRPIGERSSSNDVTFTMYQADGTLPSTPSYEETKSVSWIQTVSSGRASVAPLQEQELIQTQVYGLPRLEFTFLTTRLSQQVVMNNNLLIEWVEPQEGEPYRDWPDYYNFYDAINDWSKIAVLAFWGVDGVAVYRGTEDQISDPTMELVDNPVPAYINRAHIVFNRLELEEFGNRIPNLTFEVVQYDDVRIAEVLQFLFERAEVDPNHYDLSEVPTTGVGSYLLGYTIASVTSFRGAMEPLLEAFELDAAEIGNQIVVRSKRRSYDHIIDYGDLAAIESGDDPDTPIKLVFRDVLEMPRKLGVRFKDPEREYQPNTAIFTRQIGRSVQESSMELPIVGSPTNVKRFTRDKMRDLWLERETASWTTPHKYIYVSPSDIVLVDGSAYSKPDMTLKITSVTRGADGILEMEGVVRETTIYTPVSGETEDNGMSNPFSPRPITNVIAATIWHVLDIPALRAEDDTDEAYWVAGGTTDNWYGAGLYYSPDDVTAYEVLDVSYVDATIGVLRNASLIDPVENCNVIDYDSFIEVYLYNPNDDLTSITFEQLLAGGNPCLVGDEIICFQTATDLGNGNWRLSTLLRGRRDTVDHVGTHEVNERFVLLEENSIRAAAVQPGSDPYYKAITLGGTSADYPAEQVTINEERKTPFRPIGVTGSDDGSSGLNITWIRQDRLNIEGWSERQSEVSIEYQLAFYTTIDGASSYRAVFGVTEETFNYTAAMISADGLTSGDEFYVAVSQVSASVGAGNTTRVKITCP